MLRAKAFGCILMIASWPGHAKDVEVRDLHVASRYVNQVDRVPEGFAEVADFYGIEDSELFYSILLQESGRSLPGVGFRPWPWTLNVEGQGFYYETEQEAWSALSTFIAAGKSNIGIGYGQVTYPFNGHLLNDLYLALDPATNLRIAAEILLECQNRLGDWWQAVGCYHSPNERYAAPYRAAVKRHYDRLTGRGA